MKLTQLQENFVQHLASGLSQRQAYIKAGYSTENMSEATIDSNASRLLKNSKVIARYRELLKEQSNLFLWSQEQAFSEYEWLKNQAKNQMKEEGVRHATAQAYLSALESMNEMAFKKLELADRKLLAEIKRLEAEAEKVEKQNNPDETAEEKISQLMNRLKGVLRDE